MKMVVKDDGRIQFVLDMPILAPGMSVSPEVLAPLSEEVRRTLEELDVKGAPSPALSFRPCDDGFELYMLTVAVPGTVQLRQAKRGWHAGRRKKRTK